MPLPKNRPSGNLYEDYESPLTSEILPQEMVDAQTIELCKQLNHYLMEKFSYRTEPASQGISKNTIFVQRTKVGLYLRFKPIYHKPIDPNALVIASMGFSHTGKGYGTDLLRFLVRQAAVFGIDTIAIESPHSESIQTFAKKFGFKRMNESFFITSTAALKKMLNQ